jgi:hypothetical protein
MATLPYDAVYLVCWRKLRQVVQESDSQRGVTADWSALSRMLHVGSLSYEVFDVDHFYLRSYRKYHYGNQIKKAGTGSTCNTNTEIINATYFHSDNMEERNPLRRQP